MVLSSAAPALSLVLLEADAPGTPWHSFSHHMLKESARKHLGPHGGLSVGQAGKAGGLNPSPLRPTLLPPPDTGGKMPSQ